MKIDVSRTLEERHRRRARPGTSLVRGSCVLVASLVLAGLGPVVVASCSSVDASGPQRSSSTAPDEDGDVRDGGGDAAELENPFEPVEPRTYLAKVKNLLTGLPPSAEELDAVTKDPSALAGLIDGWLATPQAEDKLLDFFPNSFQQNQFVSNDFEELIGGGEQGQIGSPANNERLLSNLRQSFARTALAIVKEGRSFAETLTTKTYVMTPAMMSYLALLDSRPQADTGLMRTDKWWDETGRVNPVQIQNTTVIPLEQSLDPASPNYMSFYTAQSLGACNARVYASSSRNAFIVTSLLFGRASATTACGIYQDFDGLLSPEDFTSWRTVTIRKPNAGEKRTLPWELKKLRQGSELLLDIPRVGFFSTLAFQATWRTNTSNLARVTTNQTLIVALGSSFDPSNVTLPLSESGLDAQHADPSTPCYGCHKLLDPMRGYFRRNLTLNYHEQLDAKLLATAPSFSFDGVTSAGTTLDDLGRTLAEHPRFATAWAQKLCYYANSAPCSEDDPEFVRVVTAFKDDGMKFKTLVRELYASPLVTGAAATKTFKDREIVVSVARYDHLCCALTNRLGIDACNVSATARATASNLPRDSFSRGAEQPVVTSDVSMFYRAGSENLCRAVADAVIDVAAPAKSRYESANKDAAILDFVHNVMGLADGDARAPAALDILRQHHDAAVKGGAKPSDALKSTFVLACSAPSTLSIGL